MITISELALAIKAGIREDNVQQYSTMEYEEAFDVARHVLNFFGYSNRIIDNVLEPEDRDTFYMLEDAGILDTEREEITLYDGREWRIHYWRFRFDKIRSLIEAIDSGDNKPKAKDPYKDIYSDVPFDAWANRASKASKTL